MGKLILLIMVGISGSGKSTVADSLMSSYKAVKVETDAIRLELTGDASDQSKNGVVFGIAKGRICNHLKNMQNVIFDATNLSIKDRKEFIEIGKRFNAEVHACVVKTDVETAKKRNALRERKVPEFVIDKQNNKFVLPTVEEGFSEIDIRC